MAAERGGSGWWTVIWVAWVVVALSLPAAGLSLYAADLADQTPLDVQPEGYFIVFPLMIDATLILGWFVAGLVVAVGVTNRERFTPTGVFVVAVMAAAACAMVTMMNAVMMSGTPRQPSHFPGASSLSTVEVLTGLEILLVGLLAGLAPVAGLALRHCRPSAP